VLGLAASVAITRVIRAVLFGVTPTDPLTFTLALLALAAVGCLACYIPARRAMKIDPVIALRYARYAERSVDLFDGRVVDENMREQPALNA
jgi:ABC-type antimicrobial peptide transport system permease subunit